MLSLNFWVNLLLALIVFAIALIFINRNKIRAIRNFMADRIRRKAIPTLKAILPIIVSTLQSGQADMYPLFRLRADLETLCAKSDVLFAEERTALSTFLAKLSSVLTAFKTDSVIQQELDDLILSGQRAIAELSELKGSAA